MYDSNLDRVYSDRTYVSTTTVRHNGTTVAFAMDTTGRIYYSVLDLEQEEGKLGKLDVAYWNAAPGQLPFPSEIIDVMPQAATVMAMPTVKRGSQTETTPGLLSPADVDPFWSTTARLTALMPIQAVSDGRYILVFRQSVAATDPNAVFQLTGGGLSGNPARTDYTMVNGAKVAQVDGSLLCDRFVLSGQELKPVIEVRYQRSRSKFSPASKGDTLGTRDMEGQPFYEPTLKLSFVNKLTHGGFCTVQLPTAVSGLARWQIFSFNDATGRIESFNVPAGPDGLFNVAGQQLYTSPDPKYAPAVLEREPGIDFNTKQPLIPVPLGTDRAGTALRFDGTTNYTVAGSVPAPPAPTGKYTVEAWIRPSAYGGTVAATRDSNSYVGFRLYLDGQGMLNAAQSGATWTLTSANPVPLNVYTHVAITYDGTTAALFINGAAAGSTPVATAPDASVTLLVGAFVDPSQPNGIAGYFTGDIDEVRAWNVARTGFGNRGRRLTGIEPGLVTYYRCDEGAGTTLYDATRNARNGMLSGTAVWVSSDAPIGDGPGLSRDTFGLTGCVVASGLAATLYYQQEPLAVGYSTATFAQKRASRLLLTCAVSETGVPNTNVCVLDFAVTKDGRLAQTPAQISPPSIALPAPTSAQQQVSAAQVALKAAQDQLNTDDALAVQADLTFAALTAIANELNSGGFMLLNQLFYLVRPREVAREKQLKADATNLLIKWSQMLEARQRLGPDRAALDAAQANLATLTAGLTGGDEVVLPMPLIGVDRSGLSVLGGILSFAWTTSTPTLLDSSTGDVVLYFRGKDGQFFSAYYATTVSRAVKAITVTGDTVTLTARDTSAALSDITITVADGSASGLCQVQIVRGPVTETFASVPRDAVTLAGVLSGTLPPGTLLGVTQSVQGQTVQLAAPLAAALTSGTAITIGGARCRLAADAAAGASTLTLAGAASLYPLTGEVRAVGYDYSQATCNIPGMSMAHGSLIASASAGTATGPVINGTASDVTAALVPRWRGDSPGRALSFDGATRFLTLPSTAWAGITPSGDLTVEAWARPAFVAGPALFSRTRIVHASLPAAPYTLGMEGAPLTSALQFNSGTDCVDCGSALSLVGTDFTVEFWAKRTAAGHADFLFSQGSTALNPSLIIGVGTDDKFVISWGPNALITSNAYPDTGWHHWAVTYVSSSLQVTIYRDGTQVAQATFSGAYNVSGKTVIGAAWTGVSGATAAMDEVRVWTRARTAQAIGAYMNTRASGEEPGLLAYWSFQNGSAADLTGNHNDGIINGNPVQVPSGLLGYTIVGGVGGQFVRSTDTFPVGQWGHLALSFGQDFAMGMDGTDFLDAGGPDSLNLLDDLTLEAYLRLNTLGSVQGLVCKGGIASGKPGTAVPYAFYVQADGQLAFSYETGGGGPGSLVTYTSGIRLPAGAFVKVAVTRKAGACTFYIDGVPTTGAQGGGSAKPVGNDENCEIGQYRKGTTTFGLRGIVSDVRIWSVARDFGQIGVPIKRGMAGLVAWWNFPESRGGTTADECGLHPAVVHGATRVHTPDPAGNRFTLYHNGAVVGAALVGANDPLVLDGYAASQFTVAGRTNADGSLGEAFTGTLDEIRIWRTERTQEQILDNLFSRLGGKLNDLLAYYPFDSASTVAGATVTDMGLRGNNLSPSTPAPGVVISDAPISDDIPQVRSALTGVLTPFSALIGAAAPAAAEYADAQQDSYGALIGVMKRCYAFLRAGSWVLHTGFKIGDLETSWVSQAQFDPQLVGYIEGAPPVPSENLVYASPEPDYSGKSSVTFAQADKISSTLGGSTENSFDTAAKGNFKLAFGSDVYIVAAPLGAGTATNAGKAKGDVHIGFETKTSKSWSDETQLNQETGTTRTSAVSLTGNWEAADTSKQVNPAAGRRWVPANKGFAIVQSAVADIYALRLAKTGALVAYRMVPNPDIPPDWNIIAFSINPLYTKQGTLDGIIGYAPGTGGAPQAFADPDFPNAAAPGTLKGEFSYYRPIEAYAIKRRIQQEEQQLIGFYDSVSTGSSLVNQQLSNQVDKVLGGMMGDTSLSKRLDPATGNAVEGRAANRASARRNMANTYVWTAAGGLFSETTTTTDQVTWITAGKYSVSGSFTVGGGAEFSIGPVGVEISGEASFGGGYTTTSTKTRVASRGFSLDVVCQPAANLLKDDGTTASGRVDGYRFFSFYLDSSTDNYQDFFGKVIDPQWLQSTDPAAIALRRARQADRKPPCWRILHRVTFVSRVLPVPAATDPPSLLTAMHTLNMPSYMAMIQELRPYLGNATATIDTLTAAIPATLTRQFPPLAPYASDVTNIVASYYDLI